MAQRSFIKLLGRIPGPKSEAMTKEAIAHTPRGCSHATPIWAERGHGGIIQDVDGNHFLDLSSGIGVTNIGYGDARSAAAIAEQASKISHAQFNVVPHFSWVQVAKKLKQHAPFKRDTKAFLSNSGAEANENACKIARVATGRQAIISFTHAFHGRTLLTMSLTHKYAPYRYGFAPFAPEVYQSTLPYEYRGISTEQAIDQLNELALNHIGANNVAAVIIEPVLGEGGFIPVPVKFMQHLREFCTSNKIMLIVDEVQSGFGRTGKMFAIEHFGIEPDMMVLAKALGGGLPLSAVVGPTEIMDAPVTGSIGGTYNGNAVACASALEVFRKFEEEDILSNARVLGDMLEHRLEQLVQKYEICGDQRGIGSMHGLEFVYDKHSKKPNKDATNAISKYCIEHGVVPLSAGTYGNVLRFLPPLVMSSEQLEEAINVVEDAIASVSK
jgi:4-aminobutyrate aminotransferase/(S)-3-amino-2-methylpropionate transaminase